MTKKTKTILLTACIFLVSCESLQMPAFTRARFPNNEYVVLLHGLARSGNSMETMQKALIEHGYGTCNISYPSTKYPIDRLAQDRVLPKIRECIPSGDAKVSFVTHSMGGIIARELLRKKPFENLGSAVMLSPPNQGSEIVDALGDFWLFGVIHGPAGGELGTGGQSTPNRLGPADFKLGIIAGDFSVNLILSQIIPGDDDGKVSVERTKLQGMSDFLVMPASHPFIMRNEDVIRQTLFFLGNGRFRR